MSEQDRTANREKQPAELRERSALLQSIINTSPEAIVVIDDHGIIRDFSPQGERMLGYTAREVIGRNVSMLMPEPHRKMHDGYMAHYFATGEKRIIGKIRELVGPEEGRHHLSDRADGRRGVRQRHAAVHRVHPRRLAPQGRRGRAHQAERRADPRRAGGGRRRDGVVDRPRDQPAADRHHELRRRLPPHAGTARCRHRHRAGNRRQGRAAGHAGPRDRPPFPVLRPQGPAGAVHGKLQRPGAGGAGPGAGGRARERDRDGGPTDDGTSRPSSPTASRFSRWSSTSCAMPSTP